MYRLARVVAFGFKSLNFFLDLWQTRQFMWGGGTSMVITALVTYFQEKPLWLVVVLSVAVGIFLVWIVSLVFKSYALRVTENRRLRRLPRLVYDIHKRISAIRARLIRKTNWDKIDTSKVISPLLSVFGSLEINDNKISELQGKLSDAGSPPSGIASVSDAIMKKSDTSLETALGKDFWYRYLTAKLDGYKPYPNEDIGNTVSRIIHTSLSINNVLVLQSYAPDSLSLETLDSLTALSDTAKMQVYSTNVLAEEKMNDAIDKGSTRLKKYINDYLKTERERK